MMTKKWVAFLSALIMSITLCVAVSAADVSRLYDGADVLTDVEESVLLSELDSLSEQYMVDIVIATVETVGDDTVDAYVTAFYDENGYGYGDSRDGVLLLVAMQEREYRILSNGLGADAVTPAEIDTIGSVVAASLGNEDYMTAFLDFIEECAYQIDGEINGFPFKFVRNLFISLVIGFVVAFVVTGVMRGQLKSVRRQPAATAYTKQGSMQVTVANDFFLYRTVNRRKKEKSTSGSSGGGSHNVGGGKF